MPHGSFLGDITAAPLPDGRADAVTVSPAEAVRAAENNGFPPYLRPGVPDVGLGLVSYDATGGRALEDGTIDTSYRDETAWVVVYRDSPVDLHGPSEQVALVLTYSCNLVIVVAAVGEPDVIDAQQVCR